MLKLFRSTLAAAFLLAVYPQLAEGFIKRPPPTLGDVCRQATHIHMLKVEKFSAEKGVIIFKSVKELKVEGALPEGAFAKQVCAPNVKGAKTILDWAAEEKTALLFARIDNAGGPIPERLELGKTTRAQGHMYIDGYWYMISYVGDHKYWVLSYGEPDMLSRYCGTAEKLGDAVAKILLGEEVLVPAMVGDNKQDLEQRRAKVQDLRASLKILDDGTKRNVAGDKKPDDKKPEAGTVKAVDATANTITLEGKKIKNGNEPDQPIAVAKDAKISVDGQATKLADVKAGAVALLTLTEDKKSATEVVANGGTIAGTVKSVDATANTITLEGKKIKNGSEPDQTIAVAKDAKVSVDGEAKKLTDVKTGVTATLSLTVDKKTALAVTVGGAKKSK